MAGLSLSLPTALFDVLHDLDAGALLLQFLEPRQGFPALLALVGLRQLLHFGSVLVCSDNADVVQYAAAVVTGLPFKLQPECIGGGF